MARRAGGMGGMVGRFLEAAGNVIWDRHLLIKCPCRRHRMQRLIKLHTRCKCTTIREACQRNHVSHRLRAQLGPSDHWGPLPLYSKLPQMDPTCKARRWKVTAVPCTQNLRGRGRYCT